MVIHMSKIMVAGFIQIETIVKVDSLPLSDKLFTSIPGMIDTSVGGDGFNTAVAMRWLGDDVDFMSMVGKRNYISRINKWLESIGVELDTQYILQRLEAMPTSVILYSKGNFQIFEDVKDIRTVSYDNDVFEKQIKDKDMVIMSNCNFCRPLINIAKKYNKPIAVNIRSMRVEKIAKKEDFLKAADILYISDDDIDKEPYDYIMECKQKYNNEIIIVGIGSKGVILYTREDNSILEYKPVKTNEIVNTVGAGNAMFSAFLHYYLKTKDAKLSIKNALLFASYKIGFVGTSNGFMTEEQIEQWRNLIWNNSQS